MNAPRCPGQDMRYWTPDDIFLIDCPHCGGEIEFWKDEPLRRCRGCGGEVRNPRIDLGCAKWCKHAKECLGVLPESGGEAASLARRALAILGGWTENEATRRRLGALLDAAILRMGGDISDPLPVCLAALCLAWADDSDAGRQTLREAFRQAGADESMVEKAFALARATLDESAAAEHGSHLLAEALRAVGEA